MYLTVGNLASKIETIFLSGATVGRVITLFFKGKMSVLFYFSKLVSRSTVQLALSGVIGISGRD